MVSGLGSVVSSPMLAYAEDAPGNGCSGAQGCWKSLGSVHALLPVAL
jgi:hypothetical protein